MTATYILIIWLIVFILCMVALAVYGVGIPMFVTCIVKLQKKINSYRAQGVDVTYLEDERTKLITFFVLAMVFANKLIGVIFLILMLNHRKEIMSRM